jgi:hypothetical protein
MTGGRVLDPRSLARVVGIAGTVTGVIAAIVAITAAAHARRWLGFGFAGVPPRVGEVGAILLDNSRFVLGLGAAAWVAQLKVRRQAEPSGSGTLLAGIAHAVDVIVLLAVLFNVTLVGLAVGAYGWRTVVALLPHGPFEVAAFGIAANLFLNARRHPLSGREWLAAGLTSFGLLTLAAVLETFAWLG